jgi:phosphoribosyl 1,2-cyclic phosphodiesterase
VSTLQPGPRGRRRTVAEPWRQATLSFWDEPAAPELPPAPPTPFSALTDCALTPAAPPPAPLVFAGSGVAPLRLCVLGSGSGGNAVVVESGSHRLLLDAGFSCRELEQRMIAVGVDPDTIAALVLTHEHIDHGRGAGRFARRHKVPVYATAGTLEGVRLAAGTPTVVLCSGEPCEAAGFLIEPFVLPHDAREPVGLVVEDGAGRRIGLAADLGSRTRLAWGRLAELDALLLETNHDLDMLRNGPYPWSLKQRVAGRHGHLSNRDAAEGLPELLCDRLRQVVLYHLSRTNNLPALAAAAVAEVLERECSRALLTLTDQFRPTPWLEVT